MVDIFKSQNSESEDESQLQDLLGEACQTPPVPESLLRRMDRQVESVWGESPGLYRSQAGFLRRAAFNCLDRVSTGALRSWSVATVAVVVCMVVFLFGTGDQYSWADMIDRLQREPVIRISQEGLSKVFFISSRDELLAERTPQRTHVIDFRQDVVYDYRAGSEVVMQTPLGQIDANPLTDAGLLWLLLDGTGEFPRRLPAVVVESESWKRVVRDGREQVELQTQLSLQDREGLIRIVSLLDPETHFPSSVRIQSEQEEKVPRRLMFDRVMSGDPVLTMAGLPPTLPIVRTEMTLDTANVALVGDEDTLLRDEGDSILATGGSSLAVREGAGAQDDLDVVRGSINLGWKPVAAVSMSAGEVALEVDRMLAAAWREQGIEPVLMANDNELMRRMFLDLTGRIPTVSEVRDFQDLGLLAGAADELVDRLLDSPDHASHVAAMWRNFLLPEGVDFDAFGGTEPFEEWLVEQLRDRVPYDQIVRSLLLAEGRLASSGPLLFYASAKLEPEKLAGRTARVFLGMRLECAQCHDDPFEPWSQEDFWSFAAYFAQISRPEGTLEVASPVMLVRDIDRGDVMLPETETVVAPRLLDGTLFDSVSNQQHRRQQLAEWLTARENPYFARATVNRVWALMFGRGIVDPVDGFGAVNEPNVPEVLDLLAGYFIGSEFDLRGLFDAIARTEAYRFSSGGGDAGSLERRKWFAQLSVKMLSAGQLYDSIAVATLLDGNRGSRTDPFNLERIGNASRQQFVQRFGSPNEQSITYQGGIPQALTLMNGSLIEGATGMNNSGLLNSLRAPFFSSDQKVRVLFLASVAREPTAREWELCREYLRTEANGSDELYALSDILWALLNSAEFTVNH